MGDGISEYQRAITSLFARTGTSAKLGLERTRALLEQLGDPHLKYPTFHVAGTNGKGSVVAMVDALLRSKGLRVGRYTSPHLIDFRERVVVNGVQIGEQEVVEFLRRWEPEGERIGATFFELTTVMAFQHFAHQRIDVGVIETGMGGRLDATNVITPAVTAVTSIGMDHAEYLGDSIEAIAREKAGIFKPGVPAVTGSLAANAKREIESHADAIGAILVDAAAVFAVGRVRVNRDGTDVEVSHEGETATLHVGLVGRSQASNVSVALTMLDAAGTPYRLGLKEAGAVLSNLRLSGRFQGIGRFIVDVAHNPQAMQALCDTIKEMNLPRPLVAITGILRDKAWQDMLSMLASVVDDIVLTVPADAPADRAWSVSDVAKWAASHGIPVRASVNMREAMDLAAHGGTVLVCGSFYTAAEALTLLGCDTAVVG